MRLLPFFLLIMAACVSFYFLFPTDTSKQQVSVKKENKDTAFEITDEERRAFAPDYYEPKKLPVSEERTISAKNNDDIIPFIYPMDLSYKSKAEIYNIRKEAVQNSIFRNPNYEPSEDVFGQIVDNKPWLSMKLCLNKSDNKGDIQGASEEGRYINNPALLVAPEYAFFSCYCEDAVAQRTDREIPLYLKYYPEKRELVVVYNELMYCNTEKVPTWFKFNGINARDLGYKYMYVDKEKSTFNFKFLENINASNTVHEFQDYIHLGGACGHKSGCNNGSPNQPPLNFVHPCEGSYNNSGVENVIYIKLWREKPNSPNDEADIVEKIVFEKG